MPTPGQLSKKVAETLGLDETTVLSAWRVLREAELVTKGGRGRSAAKVTPRDAATLIFAICGADITKQAPDYISRQAQSIAFNHRLVSWGETEARSEASPQWMLDGIPIRHLTSLPGQHSALDVLEQLLVWGAGGRYSTDEGGEDSTPSKLTVKHFDIIARFESPSELVSFEVAVTDGKGREYNEVQSYSAPDNVTYDGRLNKPDSPVAGSRVITGDLVTSRTFTLHTIVEIGRFVAEVRD